MRVRGDARHARHAEVEGVQLQADLLREGDQEAAETRVHVDRDAERQPERGDVRHGVHDAVRVLRRARHQHDGVAVTRAAQRGRARGLGHGVHGDMAHRHAEQVTRLGSSVCICTYL